MKKRHMNALLLVALVALSAACDRRMDTAVGRYDMALFTIANSKAAELLGTNVLPVRAQLFDLETGSYPVLRLKPVAAASAKEALLAQLRSVSGLEPTDIAVKENSDLYYVDTGHTTHWVNKVSGASSFTDKTPPAVGKSEIEDHKQAVRVALEHIARLELLRPVAEEKVDIVSVSQVMNALVEEGKDEPFASFPSDYLVVFGRRYRDIPVMGSYLQLRIGPKGELLGLQRNWRQISRLDNRQTVVDESKLDGSMRSHFQKAGIAKNDKDLKNVEVVGRVCGYLEGPVSYRQESSGVGCVVNYRRRGDEMIVATSFTLGDSAYPPLGRAPKRGHGQRGSQQIPPKQPDRMSNDFGIKDEGVPDERR